MNSGMGSAPQPPYTTVDGKFCIESSAHDHHIIVLYACLPIRHPHTIDNAADSLSTLHSFDGCLAILATAIVVSRTSKGQRVVQVPTTRSTATDHQAHQTQTPLLRPGRKKSSNVPQHSNSPPPPCPCPHPLLPRPLLPTNQKTCGPWQALAALQLRWGVPLSGVHGG